MDQGMGLRGGRREQLGSIVNSKIREVFIEKGTIEQSLKEMKSVRSKAI